MPKVFGRAAGGLATGGLGSASGWIGSIGWHIRPVPGSPGHHMPPGKRWRILNRCEGRLLREPRQPADLVGQFGNLLFGTAGEGCP